MSRKLRRKRLFLIWGPEAAAPEKIHAGLPVGPGYCPGARPMGQIAGSAAAKPCGKINGVNGTRIDVNDKESRGLITKYWCQWQNNALNDKNWRE